MALELAGMFEIEGKVGKVLSLDSSPLFLSKFMKYLLPSGSSDMNLSQILRKGIAHKNKASPKDTSVLDLFAENTLDLQIQKLIDNVILNSYISTNLMKVLYDSFENRFKITSTADKISFNKLITTFVILVKAEKPTFSDLPEDYDLQKYCTEKLIMDSLEGDHTSLVYNPRLFGMIEKHVDF